MILRTQEQKAAVKPRCISQQGQKAYYSVHFAFLTQITHLEGVHEYHIYLKQRTPCGVRYAHLSLFLLFAFAKRRHKQQLQHKKAKKFYGHGNEMLERQPTTRRMRIHAMRFEQQHHYYQIITFSFSHKQGTKNSRIWAP